MEERIYTKDEIVKIRAEAYERGFREGQEKIDKLNEKYEILKGLVDFISKALSL